LELQTWSALDRITCPSPYVRDGLVRQGIDPSRITVLPNPSPAQGDPVLPGAPAAGPVTVGFVGTVGLRKGTPYFIEVARRFDRRDVRFVMVGAIRLSAKGVKRARQFVDLIGPVPRSAVREWLARFDLFYFPSTCEGSAGAVMEAMAAGLPVITSPNSGSVVRDGQEGYVVPYDDLDQAEARIASLVADQALRRRLGDAARQRAGVHDLNWYSAKLATLISELLTSASSK
jgi:glycosyltransferase involved in cell wall biosynthesis